MLLKISIIGLVLLQNIILNAAAPQDVRNLYRLNQYENGIGGEREETIGLKYKGTPEEELVINGQYKIYYLDTRHTLLVTYTADGNGNVVRTVYETAPPLPLGVSASALKSAAG